ncbi:MAG: glycerophosphodiester phosphodiesterase [Candidatus Thorarchaeota archaeon]
MINAQIVIAHRGASGLLPENTLRSFRHAVELGAHMIELDVHETFDGELVCIHDSTLDRTTDGSGEIHSFKYKDLLKLNAGQGEIIPLLDNVLKYAFGKIRVNIELKVIGVEQKVLDIIEHNNMLPNVIISSFFHGALATTRDLSDAVITAILVSKPKPDLVNYSLDFKANAINPHFDLISENLVRESHNAGLLIYPWTINDSSLMKKLLSIGVDGLITDYPDRALAILNQKRFSQ